MSNAAAPPFFFWRDEYFVIDSWIVYNHETGTSSVRIGEINYIDDNMTNSTLPEYTGCTKVSETGYDDITNLVKL